MGSEKQINGIRREPEHSLTSSKTVLSARHQLDASTHWATVDMNANDVGV